MQHAAPEGSGVDGGLMLMDGPKVKGLRGSRDGYYDTYHLSRMVARSLSSTRPASV